MGGTSLAKDQKPAKNLHVLVVADAKEEIAAAFLPSAGHPAYYYLLPGKERALGRAYAGERMPKREVIEAAAKKYMESANYKSTQIGGPKPTLYITMMWGTVNAMLDEIPATGEDDDGGLAIYNRKEMAKIIGATKLSSMQTTDPFAAEEVAQAAREDRIYIMLGAFDAEQLAKKKKVLVWRVCISIDTLEQDFPEALETMFQSAVPFFGRNEPAPRLMGDEDRRKASVELGEMQVIEEPPTSSDDKKPKSK